VAALTNILDDYDDVTFFVADKTHLYNTSYRTFLNRRENPETEFSGSLFNSEQSLSAIAGERKNWLEKVKNRSGSKAKHICWNILSADDISDQATFAILRRVNILSIVDEQLKRDIHAATTSYATAKGLPEPMASLISERYIIEELALSIRIKIVEEIYDEYYVGTSLIPMVDLYRNKYLATPWELAGLPEKSQTKFRFFDSVSEAGFWQEVQD
jgi:hypothetical protein